MTAGITSRRLKKFQRKLSSDSFDTAQEKRTTCEIQEFLMARPLENSIKILPTGSKHFNFPFLFTLLESSSNSQALFKLKDFQIDGKIGTPD